MTAPYPAKKREPQSSQSPTRHRGKGFHAESAKDAEHLYPHRKRAKRPRSPAAHLAEKRDSRKDRRERKALPHLSKESKMLISACPPSPLRPSGLSPCLPIGITNPSSLGHPDCQIARIRAITTQAEIRMSTLFGWLLMRKLRDGNKNIAQSKIDSSSLACLCVSHADLSAVTAQAGRRSLGMTEF